MDKYGTHNGITCDGCACRPIQGFRYKCKNCLNHDLCETCHTAFNEGTLKQDPQLARLNKVSQNVEDHQFETVCETDTSFVPISGQRQGGQAAVVQKKIKPNVPCPCGAGKKYKKCCGAPGATPKPPAAAASS